MGILIGVGIALLLGLIALLFRFGFALIRGLLWLIVHLVGWISGAVVLLVAWLAPIVRDGVRDLYWRALDRRDRRRAAAAQVTASTPRH